MRIRVLLVACMAAATCYSAAAAAAPVELKFHDMFVPTSGKLALSDTARSLVGKRARLTGFMVDMELPVAGGFYLAEKPVTTDESGNGTADLPPGAVFVIVRSRAGQLMPFIPGAIRVTGIFDAGYRAESDGRSTMLRLTLDRPEDLRHDRARAVPRPAPRIAPPAHDHSAVSAFTKEPR